jgi:phosphatidylserine/phosphatidylglycerophosphate/cardiolipin synthase-like enzyme
VAETAGYESSSADGASDEAASLDPTRWSSVISGAISSNAVLRTGNAVTYLIDGPATFKEMVKAFGTATGSEHYIYLLGWQLVDDFDMAPPAATHFRDLMTAASGRGVQVRAMLWKQVGSTNKAQVDAINKLSTGAAILDNETPSILGAHHQKIVVVKGSQGLIGFCGGIDINSDRVAAPPSPSSTSNASGAEGGSADGKMAVASSGGGGNGSPLHDVHCKIVGPAAFDVLTTFIRRWDHHPASGGIDSAKGALLGRKEPVPTAATTPSSTGRACSVAIGRTFTPKTPGTTVPRERDIQGLLLAAIANAQRFIYMEDQYLINPECAAALNRRVPSLQHLTILIAGSEISDLPCKWTYRQDFINAVTAGLSGADAAKVRVFRLVTPPATTPPVYGTHTYVHAKTWIFDDELAVIGSANCNRRGWQSDSEANAFIFDDAAPPGGALTFAQCLRRDLWAEHLGVPASSVTDGVASASQWVTSTAKSRVLPYDPAADSDGRAMLCGTSFTHDKVDPPSP